MYKFVKLRSFIVMTSSRFIVRTASAISFYYLFALFRANQNFHNLTESKSSHNAILHSAKLPTTTNQFVDATSATIQNLRNGLNYQSQSCDIVERNKQKKRLRILVIQVKYRGLLWLNDFNCPLQHLSHLSH